MTGSVVLTPERKHQCAPGWSVSEDESKCFPGQHYAIPPAAHDYPEGTVWECSCGSTWVSQGPPSWNSPGMVAFRRERRLERRRRLRST